MLYVRFLILGLATGSLYALTALGIVLVSRASGVLNFASGAMGAAGAFLTYDLRDTYGAPTPVAVLAGLALGCALGVAAHLVLMVLLRETAPLSKLIATLGLLTVVQGVITVIWGEENRGQPESLLPTRLHRPFDDLVIPEDRLWLIGISLLLAVILKLVYTKTSFGLATAAVAENREVAAIMGLSTSRIELINFAVAGGISAGAAILLAPVLSLSVSALIIIVVPALAAALIGRFTNFGMTVLAALAIGVLQAEIPQLGFVKDQTDGSLAGLPDAVPVLLIAIITAVRGRGRLSRGEVTSRLPLPGSGRLNPVLLALATGLGLLTAALASDSWIDPITTTFAIGILVLSIVVVTGYGGQLSLAQFALAGFGLWVAARLYATQDMPFVLAALLGVALSVPAGLLVALPALRARGVELAVATLGLALAIQVLILGNVTLTGGFNGTTVSGASLFGWSIDSVEHPHRYASLALLLLVLATVVVTNLRRGRAGRRLLAVRSNERAAASLGVGVYSAKLYAFGLGAGLAGLAGIVLGFKDQNVRFDQFDIFGSVTAVQYAVVGGIGCAGGAVIGASLALGAVGARLAADLSSSAESTRWITIGASALVILLIRLAPDGLAARLAALVSSRRPVRSQQLEAEQTAWRERTPVALELQGISVRFGGVQALDDVSLTVTPGQVLGVIGPNGAGKTTLLDIATGFTKPTSGSLRLAGKSIASWSPERRARDGLGRSFQAVELFEELSVRENLLVASDRQALSAYVTDLLLPRKQRPSAAMASIVETFELSDVLDKRPSELSQGQARLVGIARAMCAEPSLLFLDEPAAGLDSHERAELGRSIRALATEHGIGIVLVEHDVPLVMGVCDVVVALDFGRVIAQGPPQLVREHPAVVASYIGVEAHA
jgi:sulfate-transporting ATPase